MKLLDLLPERHRKCEETKQFQKALQGAADGLADAYDEMLQQLNASTATMWIDLWEQAYGIQPDATKPLEHRRSRLLSKMRGSGTTTVQLLRNVAASFSGGNVEVKEVPQESRFEIVFVDKVGIPPNMEDLTAAIEEIKPAHLAYSYVINYHTYSRLKAYTHAELSAYTHYSLRNEALN